MRLGGVALAVAALLSAAVPASACKGKTVFFHDDFKVLNQGWGLFDKETVAVANGALKVTPKQGYYTTIYYRADVYDQADVCVDAEALGGAGVPDGDGGMLFADEDHVGFYYFWISPKNKTAGVSQWSESTGKYVYPVPAKLAQYNFTAGAKNTLRVTVKKGQATAYINDRLFVSLAIKAPEIGGFFALRAGRINSNPVSWTFSNLTITDAP
jgi:hypothetical protein